MEYIMKIGDTVMIPSVGYIISGSNSEITKDNMSILSLRDKHIVVRTGTDEFMFKVLEVKVSFSITENLIIGIKVEESDDFSKIKAGDLLYKL